MPTPALEICIILFFEIVFVALTLRRIDELLDNENGRKIICKRLPEDAVRTVLQGPRINAVDVLGSRVAEASGPEAERGRREARLLIHQKKNELLKSWAIASGNWHTQISVFTNDINNFAKGIDSIVLTGRCRETGYHPHSGNGGAGADVQAV